MVEGCQQPFISAFIPKGISVGNGSETPVQGGISFVGTQSIEENHKPKSWPKHW